MALDVSGALETLEDERILQSADDFLDHPGLAGVTVAAADDHVENLHQVQHVLMDFAAGGRLVGIDLDDASHKVDLSRLEGEGFPVPL